MVVVWWSGVAILLIILQEVYVKVLIEWCTEYRISVGILDDFPILSVVYK